MLHRFVQCTKSLSGISSAQISFPECVSGSFILRHGFFSSGYSLAGDGVCVEVPAMGDSITEGSIVSVKEIGSVFGEDEVIAQIETDKVTIDVKAPVAGELEEVQVKEGDTVKVGQLIGRIKAGGDVSPAVSTTKSVQAPEAVVHSNHRVGGISFPTRRTPTGELISAMKADAATTAQALRDGVKMVSPAVEKPGSAQMVGGWAEGSPVAGTRVRNILTDGEMERIMLGGADP